MEPAGKKVIQVVAGLICRDGALLVCQRRGDSTFPLKWEFPGGKVEEGEDEIAALKRELQEELAIEVRQVRFFHRHDHVYENGPAVSLRFYQVLEFSGTPRNSVFEQISWAKPSDLETLDFLEADKLLIGRIASAEGALFSV